jgi:hypothetical protein
VFCRVRPIETGEVMPGVSALALPALICIRVAYLRTSRTNGVVDGGRRKKLHRLNPPIGSASDHGTIIREISDYD